MIRGDDAWACPKIEATRPHRRSQCQRFLLDRRVVDFVFVELPAQITYWMFDTIRNLETSIHQLLPATYLQPKPAAFLCTRRYCAIQRVSTNCTCEFRFIQ